MKNLKKKILDEIKTNDYLSAFEFEIEKRFQKQYIIRFIVSESTKFEIYYSSSISCSLLIPFLERIVREFLDGKLKCDRLIKIHYTLKVQIDSLFEENDE